MFTGTVNGAGMNVSFALHEPTPVKVPENTIKYLASLKVWGCFTYDGVRKLMLFVNEKINQNNYLELLCNYLPD